MTLAERIVLYGMVFGLRPRRCLEIGTFQGGSAAIIVGALDDIGAGTLTCVDPQPKISPERWEQLEHRATLITGGSPDVLPRASDSAGGRFDFALIDGAHELPDVVGDIEGVLPILDDQAYLLFHDAHYAGVRDGIDAALRAHPDLLIDCGMISAGRTVDGGVSWGGIRMLRHERVGSPQRDSPADPAGRDS